MHIVVQLTATIIRSAVKDLLLQIREKREVVAEKRKWMTNNMFMKIMCTLGFYKWSQPVNHLLSRHSAARHKTRHKKLKYMHPHFLRPPILCLDF